MSRFSHFTFKSQEGLTQGGFQQVEANTSIRSYLKFHRADAHSDD